MKNRMRNAEFLQNYKPAWLRSGISGKLVLSDEHLPEQATDREWWIQLFQTAIEDLKAGNYVNGKPMKSTVRYWLDQIELAQTFTPKPDRAEYMRQYMKQYSSARLQLRADNEEDQRIGAWLDQQPNKSEYLKRLVLDDMKKAGK